MSSTVILTREPPRNDELRAALAPRCRVLEVPLTTTSFRAAEDVARDITAAGLVATIAVTSARAATAAALAVTTSPAATVIAVGDATAAALRAVVSVPVQSSTGGATALAALVVAGPVLVLGAAAPRPELDAALGERGIAIARVAVYDTEPVELGGLAREELRLGDVLVIGAPSAWRVARAEVRHGATVVVLGPTTRDAVAADHARVVMVDDRGLAATVMRVLDDREQPTRGS